MTEYEESSIALLGEILGQLKQLNAAAEVRKPHICHTKQIEEYSTFDWEAFGAKVVERDDDGVCLVEFKGEIYSRRSPQNKFAPAIWFSRSDGKDEDGNTKYVKLVIFKKFDFEPEPIPAKARQYMQQAPRAVAPPPEPPLSVSYATTAELKPISESLAKAGMDSDARKQWMRDNGASDLAKVPRGKLSALQAAAQASAKAAQDSAVLAAKSLAGAMGGEVVSA